MNREQRKADREYEREQRKAERNTPERIAQRKERRAKWKRAGIGIASALFTVLRFLGIPLPDFSTGNLKNESNIFLTSKKENRFMRNFNTSGFNPLSIIFETLVRFVSRSPKYFRLLQWVVFVIGAAIAIINYALDPSVAIDVFGPKGHEIAAEILKYLGIAYVALKLPVEEKPAEVSQ